MFVHRSCLIYTKVDSQDKKNCANVQMYSILIINVWLYNRKPQDH